MVTSPVAGASALVSEPIHLSPFPQGRRLSSTAGAGTRVGENRFLTGTFCNYGRSSNTVQRLRTAAVETGAPDALWTLSPQTPRGITAAVSPECGLFHEVRNSLRGA